MSVMRNGTFCTTIVKKTTRERLRMRTRSLPVRDSSGDVTSGRSTLRSTRNTTHAIESYKLILIYYPLTSDLLCWEVLDHAWFDGLCMALLRHAYNKKESPLLSWSYGSWIYIYRFLFITTCIRTFVFVFSFISATQKLLQPAQKPCNTCVSVYD